MAGAARAIARWVGARRACSLAGRRVWWRECLAFPPPNSPPRMAPGALATAPTTEPRPPASAPAGTAARTAAHRIEILVRRMIASPGPLGRKPTPKLCRRFRSDTRERSQMTEDRSCRTSGDSPINLLLLSPLSSAFGRRRTDQGGRITDGIAARKLAATPSPLCSARYLLSVFRPPISEITFASGRPFDQRAGAFRVRTVRCRYKIAGLVGIDRPARTCRLLAGRSGSTRHEHGVDHVRVAAPPERAVIAGRGQNVGEGIAIGSRPERRAVAIGRLGLNRNGGSGAGNRSLGRRATSLFAGGATGMVAGVPCFSAAEQPAQNGSRRARHRTDHGAEASRLRAGRHRGKNRRA